MGDAIVTGDILRAISDIEWPPLLKSGIIDWKDGNWAPSYTLELDPSEISEEMYEPNSYFTS